MARDFDGVDDRVRMSTVPAALLVDVLTVSVWIDADAADGLVVMLREDAADFNNVGWNLYITSGSLARWQIDTGAETNSISTTNVVTGGWQHIAAWYDGANMAVYVNGTQEDTDAKTGAVVYGTGTKRLDIGNYVGNTGFEYDGRIAEFGYWSVKLSDNEIASLAKGVTPTRVQPGNLLAYAPLGGQGSVEPNYTRQGNNFDTVTGAVVANHAPVQPAWGFDYGWRGAFTAAAPAAGWAHLLGGRRNRLIYEAGD